MSAQPPRPGFMASEPIWFVAQLQGLFQATLLVLQAFEVITWDGDQAGAVHGLGGVVLAFLGAWWSRRQSVPIAQLNVVQAIQDQQIADLAAFNPPVTESDG